MKANANRYRALGQPAFLVVVAVLLVSAIALNTVTNTLGLVFKKLPVPQPADHPFKSIPKQMGHWYQISEDEQLDPEIQQTLGTDKYLYRDYLRIDNPKHTDIPADSEFVQALQSIVTDDKGTHVKSDIDVGLTTSVNNDFKDASPQKKINLIQAAMKDKKSTDIKLAMSYVQMHHANDIINMGLTYYTGMVDTVAHVPDRCYVADGYDPTDDLMVHPILDLGRDYPGTNKSVEVRLMHFEDQTGSGRVDKKVAYFFNCDGAYMWGPTDVRIKLQSLTQKYGYYQKTELMQVGKDTDAAGNMADFLSGAKPEIEKCLPDWDKVNKQAK